MRAPPSKKSVKKPSNPPPVPTRLRNQRVMGPVMAGGALVATTAPEPITWGLILVILGLIGVIGYLISVNMRDVSRPAYGTASAPLAPLAPISSSYGSMSAPIVVTMDAPRSNPYDDPYSPPLKNDGFYFPPDSADVRGLPVMVNQMAVPARAGVPINVKTRGGANSDYIQLGLLTRERQNRTEDTSFRDPMILPLFGRRVMNGRDKYQYYTMSNTGAVNTKLPVKIGGRNCIGEYGCDELMNGGVAYVEGYNDTFQATVYENAQYSYIPYL